MDKKTVACTLLLLCVYCTEQQQQQKTDDSGKQKFTSCNRRINFNSSGSKIIQNGVQGGSGVTGDSNLPEEQLEKVREIMRGLGINIHI